MVNYIEHYGLLRDKDSNGIYESITNMHSWNSRSTKIMWRLQRHSDHHHQSYRPYQILKMKNEAPTYPFDYNYGFVIALVPPIWFYCVNPKIDAMKAKEKGLVPKCTYDNFEGEKTDLDKHIDQVIAVYKTIVFILLTYATYYCA